MQGWLIRPAIRHLGRRNAMVIGLSASILAFAMMVFVSSGLVALLFIPVSSLGGLVSPALRAELSDGVPAGQQGELQGATASLRAIGMIVAPFVYTSTFALTTGAGGYVDLPGAVFAIPAALNLMALVLLLRAEKPQGAMV